MALEATIKAKVQEYISKDEMFTSVDIANAVKRDGTWIKNRDVRMWLHANVNDTTIFGTYSHIEIDVCGGAARATLYYPTFKDPDDYTARDQVAMTPDEVKDIQKQKAGSPTSDAAPDINSVLSNKNVADISVIIKSKERIKIPGVFTKKLGLNPGDQVDPSLLKVHYTLPGKLIVNKDYRISIPRNCINWGTSPVNVIFSGGVVLFDKA